MPLQHAECVTRRHEWWNHHLLRFSSLVNIFLGSVSGLSPSAVLPKMANASTLPADRLSRPAALEPWRECARGCSNPNTRAVAAAACRQRPSFLAGSRLFFERWSHIRRRSSSSCDSRGQSTRKWLVFSHCHYVSCRLSFRLEGRAYPECPGTRFSGPDGRPDC
jgi:hypothetical protein